MQAVSHNIQHQYQPTPTNCSQTALSIMLGHYDVSLTPQEIEKSVPQTQDSEGNDIGTVSQALATWCAEAQGFKTVMYTFDCQIIDQSWQDKSAAHIISRLQAGLANGWDAPGLGPDWSNEYRQAYIDYLQAGNRLVIQPSVTSKLLYKLVGQGPLFLNVCINTLYGQGRTKDNKLNDVQGRAWNHSIVLYGNDQEGNFLIADPIVKPGLHTVEAERMIAAVTASQTECDNLLFQLQPVL